MQADAHLQKSQPGKGKITRPFLKTIFWELYVAIFSYFKTYLQKLKIPVSKLFVCFVVLHIALAPLILLYFESLMSYHGSTGASYRVFAKIQTRYTLRYVQ